MSIVDEDIVRVREATDIVAVISGHTMLKKVGNRWMGLCPFHSEKSGSFSVNQVEGLYHCFGCGQSGDAITFVREIEHLDFVGAVEWLANKASITLRYTERDESESRKRAAKQFAVMEQAVAWYHDRLLSGADAGRARGYLRARGFDREMVEQYQVGWAPDSWDELCKALKAPSDLLVECGLGFVNRLNRNQDFFRARILFPIFDERGRPVAFGGRKLPDAEGPKYQNSRENTLYNKSKTLYGLNWAKADVVASREVIVCEGYTDVIGFFHAGIPRAVATCGTALTEDHIRQLKRFTNRIVLAYDADEAGQAAAERVYEWEQRHEISLSVLELPAGSDPDELSRSDPEALAAAVVSARPFLGFRIGRILAAADMGSPEGRARAAQLALLAVGEHPAELVRDQYVMEIADRCQIEPDRLRELLRNPLPIKAEPVRPSRRRDEELDDDGRVTLSERPAVVDLRENAEVEALRLLTGRREEIVDRLAPVLFTEGLTRRSYEALAAAPDVHTVVGGDDMEVASLVTRVSVEESFAEVDDVINLLAREAGLRVLRSLERTARMSEDPLEYAPLLGWLKLQVDLLGGDQQETESAGQLVAWLAAEAAELEC